MTGAESAKFIGKQGRLHGAGVPWGVPVVIVDTRRSYGADQFKVAEPGRGLSLGSPTPGALPTTVWVEASRVEVEVDEEGS